MPPGRVIGSGTTLDTARFRLLLATYLGVDSQHVHGYVVGEHGDSEVLTWSLVTAGGMPLGAFCHQNGLVLTDAVRDDIEHRVRDAAYQVIGGKGSTYYGIGAALAQVVNVILRDQRSIFTVCTPVVKVTGVYDATLSLPHLVGKLGVLASFPLPLDAKEQSALARSAQVVCQAIEELDAEASA